MEHHEWQWLWRMSHFSFSKMSQCRPTFFIVKHKTAHKYAAKKVWFRPLNYTTQSKTARGRLPPLHMHPARGVHLPLGPEVRDQGLGRSWSQLHLSPPFHRCLRMYMSSDTCNMRAFLWEEKSHAHTQCQNRMLIQVKWASPELSPRIRGFLQMKGWDFRVDVDFRVFESRGVELTLRLITLTRSFCQTPVWFGQWLRVYTIQMKITLLR